MANDDLAKPFRETRASYADTAKWIMSGLAAVVALAVGGTTISQIGGLALSDWRLHVGLLALVVAVASCWIPFSRGVDVMASAASTVSLRDFAGATSGQIATARERADALLAGQLPEKDILAFVGETERLRAIALSPSETEAHRAAAAGAIVSRADLHTVTAQTCMNVLMTLRFEALRRSIAFPGALILALFLVFAWAMTGPKGDEKPLAAPREADLAPDRNSVIALETAKIDPSCFSPVAHVIEYSTLDGGRYGSLLVSPIGPPKCPPFRVTVEGPAQVAPAT